MQSRAAECSSASPLQVWDRVSMHYITDWCVSGWQVSIIAGIWHGRKGVVTELLGSKCKVECNTVLGRCTAVVAANDLVACRPIKDSKIVIVEVTMAIFIWLTYRSVEMWHYAVAVMHPRAGSNIAHVKVCRLYEFLSNSKRGVRRTNSDVFNALAGRNARKAGDASRDSQVW